MADEQITLQGAGALRQRLSGIVHRCQRLESVAPAIFRELEAGEKLFFAGGHDVQTGRTMRSLTEPAAAYAVREARSGELTFGTSLWYAKYLGPELLRVNPITAQRIAGHVLNHIVHGGESA